MRKLSIILILNLLLFRPIVKAQTTYLPLHSEEEDLLERIEVKSGALSPYNFSLKPVSRKDAMDFIKMQRVNILHGDLLLSSVDQYNIKRAESLSSEWVGTAEGLDAAIPSKKPILGFLYPVQSDAIHIHTDDFFLVANPVIYIEGFKESNVEKIGYINTRGLEVRGRLLDKLGFYTMLADDQDRPPSYVAEYEQKSHSFPGKTYYGLSPNGNYDFFLAKGYLDASLAHEHLNITFGYDNNFLGAGIRSLILSDFSPPATFLRLRANWGKFSYQSLFLQLTADYQKPAGDYRLAQKYAAIHQLGYQASPWLDLGIFESSIFGGKEQLKVTDLIPVIGYQSLARSLGANQTTSLGLSFKAIALRHLQFYGQAYFGSIDFSEINNQGWWGNRIGIQIGSKYFDAFSVANLDLQGEVNIVRPFTYAAGGDNTDYTHYNQPLTHPDGAGFAEIIGKIQYQPFNKLYLTAKGIYSLRGSDTAFKNNGINPLENWNLRQNDYGYGWIPGTARTAFYLNINAAYEIRPNLFFEAGITNWNWKIQEMKSTSTSFYGGIRWNMVRKEYDSY